MVWGPMWNGGMGLDWDWIGIGWCGEWKGSKMKEK